MDYLVGKGGEGLEGEARPANWMEELEKKWDEEEAEKLEPEPEEEPGHDGAWDSGVSPGLPFPHIRDGKILKDGFWRPMTPEEQVLHCYIFPPSIQLQDQNLEVGGFGQMRMYRMVRSGTCLAQDAAPARRRGQAAGHLLGEGRRFHLMGAGRQQKKAAGGNQPGRFPGQFAVPPEPRVQILAGRDEGRRIGHHQIEFLAIG